MPALRLTATSRFATSEFDAIGMDASNVPEFIAHVGLFLSPSESLNGGDGVGLLHMRPPLERREDACAAHVVGTVKLTVPERLKIQMFADRRIGENELAGTSPRFQYAVRPHRKPVESNGTVIRECFSCAGFVVEAYRSARIDIVDTNETSLPAVSLDQLRVVYSHPEQLAYLDDAKKRERWLNLPGTGGWPVLLPGHVLNALVRDEGAIRNGPPYKVVQGDEFFQSRKPGVVATVIAQLSAKLKSVLQNGSEASD